MGNKKEVISSGNLFLLLVVIFSIITTTSGISQTKDSPLIKHFGEKSGAPQQAYEVIINNNGNILVASAFGIYNYDGIKWHTSVKLNQVGKLPLFFQIRKDKYKHNGYIIGGNRLNGFAQFQQGGLQFTKIVSDASKEKILGAGLFEVTQTNNKSYFLGSKAAGYVYDHISQKTTRIKGFNKPSSRLWFFTYKGNIFLQFSKGESYILEGNTWKKYYSKEPLIDKLKPRIIKKFGNNKYFIISQDKQAYILSKDNVLNKVDDLSRILKDEYLIRSKVWQDNIYLKTMKMLLVYNLKNNEITFKKRFDKPRLMGQAIDKLGNVWLTSTQGVFFIELNTPFSLKKNKNISNIHYQNNQVFSINRAKKKLLIQRENESYIKNNIGSIYNIVNLEGKDYVCTSTGVFFYNSQTQNLKLIVNTPSLSWFKQGNNFINIYTDKITIYDSKYVTLKNIPLPENTRITTSIKHQNSIFYSTNTDVFQITLNQEGNDIKTIKKLLFPRKTSYDFDFDIYKGVLYLGNAKGIFKLDQNNKLIEITKEIKNLKKDKNLNYLVYFSNIKVINPTKIFTAPALSGINAGINIPGYLIKNKDNTYTYRSNVFKRLEKFTINEFTTNLSGHFIFITNDHIIEYDPNKKVNTDYAFKTYIRSAQVKTKRIDSTSGKEALVDSTIYYGNLAKPPAVSLSYPHNTLTFTYASDSWAAYERNLYSYQLVGLDEGWSDWSTEQKKEYTHLREGTYTFKVRCKNVYGTISSVDSYTFTILPPWHRTTWAYTLYVLAGLAVLVGGSYGYSHYRSRQLYRRNQHLEQVVAERTEEILAQKEEISQQAEMLQSANHELKQANEQIKQANEQLKREKDEKVKIYLQEATEAANKLQQVRNTLANEGSDEAQKILKRAISGVDEFVIIREKVRKEYPDFTERIDQALMDKKITKLVWQVGYCLKLGMLPAEVAEVLPTNNRSVSTHGSNLRRLGILEPIKKS